MTDDEKTQRIISEQRHNEIVQLLKDIALQLGELVQILKTEEKKEGE